MLAMFITLLLLTHEFHPAILIFASTKRPDNTPLMANDEKSIEFLRRQLEEAMPPEETGVERRYIVPNAMDLSEADRVWESIAPFISLGYDRDELVKSLEGLGLPKEIKANNATVLIDYSSLRVNRNRENGEVYVEIPLACDKPLPSTHYNITGFKRLVKLFNVTIVRLYEVSANASELFNVAYVDSAGRLSKAILNFSLETYRVQAYFPSLENQPPQRSASASYPMG